jgi:hypothetical protein
MVEPWAREFANRMRREFSRRDIELGRALFGKAEPELAEAFVAYFHREMGAGASPVKVVAKVRSLLERLAACDPDRLSKRSFPVHAGGRRTLTAFVDTLSVAEHPIAGIANERCLQVIRVQIKVTRNLRASCLYTEPMLAFSDHALARLAERYDHRMSVPEVAAMLFRLTETAWAVFGSTDDMVAKFYDTELIVPICGGKALAAGRVRVTEGVDSMLGIWLDVRTVLEPGMSLTFDQRRQAAVIGELMQAACTPGVSFDQLREISARVPVVQRTAATADHVSTQIRAWRTQAG